MAADERAGHAQNEASNFEATMTATRILFTSIILLFLIAFGRSVHAQDAKKMDKRDMQALSRMAQADMAEIATGKLAAQKASSDEVKKYGQHMVDEHSKMLDEGKQVAQSKGVKPPAGPDKKHQSAMKKLQGLSGAGFDRQYMDQMVKDHQQVLKLAQREAKDGKDPEVKALAEKGAPHIQQHLDEAKKIQASLKSDTSSKKSETSSKK
jgi:putative membrane protein